METERNGKTGYSRLSRTQDIARAADYSLPSLPRHFTTLVTIHLLPPGIPDAASIVIHGPSSITHSDLPGMLIPLQYPHIFGTYIYIIITHLVCGAQLIHDACDGVFFFFLGVFSFRMYIIFVVVFDIPLLHRVVGQYHMVELYVTGIKSWLVVRSYAQG